MKMKKIIALILALAMCAIPLAGCGSSNNSTATDADLNANTNNEPATDGNLAENTDERTKLIVGFDADFPPYGFVENGEYVGFDLDLAAAVCDYRGWELVLQPIDWSAKLMEINSGTIDCIWNGFTMTEERLTEYTWSDPYVDNSQVFVVAEDSGIASLADLAGKVVAVQADSSAEAALNEEDNASLLASFGELLQVPDYNTAFMNLEAGAVDAVAMDIGVANYQISQRSGGYIILSEYLAEEQYGIGFKLGNTDLRDAVQATLITLVANGTFDEIVQKWDMEYGIADSVILGK